MATRGKSAPPITRGLQCSKCGGDRWYARRGNGFACAICARADQRSRRADPAFEMWHGAKRRAQRSGVPFTITKQHIHEAWPSDGRCPALGLRLVPGKGKISDASPTLDRLNSDWGYEPGNIAVISYRANRAKGSLTAGELERLAAWMRGNGLD